MCMQLQAQKERLEEGGTLFIKLFLESQPRYTTTNIHRWYHLEVVLKLRQWMNRRTFKNSKAVVLLSMQLNVTLVTSCQSFM